MLTSSRDFCFIEKISKTFRLGKPIEYPKQTPQELGANYTKARSKRIENSEQTTQKPGANYRRFFNEKIR